MRKSPESLTGWAFPPVPVVGPLASLRCFILNYGFCTHSVATLARLPCLVTKYLPPSKPPPGQSLYCLVSHFNGPVWRMGLSALYSSEN